MILGKSSDNNHRGHDTPEKKTGIPGKVKTHKRTPDLLTEPIACKYSTPRTDDMISSSYITILGHHLRSSSSIIILDHAAPQLPLSQVVQDLHNRTDPTQEICATVGHTDRTGPTQQHELDHSKTGNRSALLGTSKSSTENRWSV